MNDRPVWSDFELVERAMALANAAHRDDVRKGPRRIPYLSHVWSVAALVLEHGGTDEQVAAALLHDVAEDRGGERQLAEIERHCGPVVARMVRDLSDSLVDTTDGTAKAAWHDRKRRYVAHARTLDRETLLVSACDKLHNLRTLVTDLRRDGPSVWDRFNAATGPADHLWYHATLIDLFAAASVDEALVDELRRQLAAARELAGPESAVLGAPLEEPDSSG